MARVRPKIPMLSVAGLTLSADDVRVPQQASTDDCGTTSHRFPMRVLMDQIELKMEANVCPATIRRMRLPRGVFLGLAVLYTVGWNGRLPGGPRPSPPAAESLA